jgi:hypothetical protein
MLKQIIDSADKKQSFRFPLFTSLFWAAHSLVWIWFLVKEAGGERSDGWPWLYVVIILGSICAIAFSISGWADKVQTELEVQALQIKELRRELNDLGAGDPAERASRNL